MSRLSQWRSGQPHRRRLRARYQVETLESRFLLDGSKSIAVVPIRAYAAIVGPIKSPPEPQSPKPTTVVPIHAFASTAPVGTSQSASLPTGPIFISDRSLHALALTATGSSSAPGPSSSPSTPNSTSLKVPPSLPTPVATSYASETSGLTVTTKDGEPARPGVDPDIGDTLTPEDLAASVPVSVQSGVQISGPDSSAYDEAHTRIFSAFEGGQTVSSIQNMIAGTSFFSRTTSALPAILSMGPSVIMGQVAAPASGVVVGPYIYMNWQMYKVQPGPNTNTINVVLRPQSADGPLDEGVSVIDGTGHRLDEVFPNPIDGSISLDISLLMHGSKVRGPFFVQVFTLGTAGATQAPALTMAPYLLTFTQDNTSSSSHLLTFNPFAPRLALPSGLVPGVASKNVNSSNSSLVTSGQDANPGFVATSELVSSGVIPIPAATGPLPTRSAAPLGGVLDGDPIPQIDRLDAAKVDLELIGSGESGTGGGPRADEVVAVPQDGPDGPLVAVRGSGGFPLLASGLGDVRSVGPAASIAFMPWTSSPSLVADESATTTSDFELGETENQLLTQTVRRDPAVFGLSLAMTLGFGLVLPDLVSTFQQREPRRFRLRLRLYRWPRRDRV